MGSFKRLAKIKNVPVKFVGDEDIIENLRFAKEKSTGKKKEDIIYDHSKADDIDLSENEEDYQPPSVLCPLQNEINGQEMFQLSKKTPKKTPGKKQVENSTPVSRKSSIQTSSSTPKGTPKATPKRTPKTLQHRPRRRIQQNLIEESEYDSNPEDTNSEDSDGSVSTDNESPIRNKSASLNRKSKSFAEDYFTAQKNAKSATSNRTLSKVILEKTNVCDLHELLQSTKAYHTNEKKLLYNNYQSLYRKWMFQLHEGFNILLHGVGSKCMLLQKFQLQCLSDSLCVVINGFYSSLTIKQVLNSIVEEVIEHDGSFANVFDQAKFIRQHFSLEKEHLYILIHNIDGVSLRSAKCQTILSNLASCPSIHIIASVDHINCSLIWNQTMLSEFQWIWYDCPTYEPYILESSYQNTILKEQSSQLLLSSLLHVFQSLTPNTQGVFLVIARYQMTKKESGSYLGITFQEWYQACREAFLVNSESTMNAQMSEFKNHRLLSSRKSPEGIEHWYIPIDDNTLEQFLERDDIN